MKKFDKNYIKYHLLIDFLFIVAIVIYLVFSGMEGEDSTSVLLEMSLILGGVGLVAYIIKTIYSILYIKCSGYELKEKEIFCKRGVIFRKASLLEYAKMHAVNKRQNVIQKLFKIAVLTIDSGATHNGASAEIVIIENSKVVDALQEQLKRLQKGESLVKSSEVLINECEKENLYSFSSKKMLLYSALNLLSSLAVILVLGVLVSVAFAILKTTFTSVFLISYKNFYLAFLMIAVCCILVACLLSFIISFLSSFFIYYDFKIYKNQTDIEISYGLLVKHTNTFKLSKIKGVKISQGIIKRIFGYVSVNLEVIGYNPTAESNESQNSNVGGVLMPFCNVNEVNEKLSKILPDYVPNEKQIKSVKYSPFVLFPIGFICFFAFIGLGILVMDLALFRIDGAIIFKVALSGVFAVAIVVLFVIVLNVFSYKNNGITITDDKITIYNGSIIKNCTVIKKDNIIAIEDLTTPLRKKANIYSYIIHYRTNALTNEVKVNNLPKETAKKLLELLKY